MALRTNGAGVSLLVGVVLLYVGAESLVKGARGVSTDLGVRAAVAGVTVVAFATTAPELFVAVVGQVEKTTTIGLGAVIGSNVANICLVLGLSALVRPLAVSRETVRRHLPFMALAAVLLVGLGSDGTLSTLDGGALLLALVAFTAVLLHGVPDADDADGSGEEHADDGAVVADGGTGFAPPLGRLAAVAPRDLLFLVVGLGLLFVGARRLVDGGTAALYLLGGSDRLVGVTVLALGTSLPELAASLVSAVRGHADFSVGNVVGSNIYNVLAVLGVLTLLSPIRVPTSVVDTDFPVLLGATAFCVLLLVTRGRVGRVAGVLLLGGYAGYVSLLV
ncbi:calcium/sodium antiporter [Halobaculum lipolyticum]|uniref:Calcium/sodium antiporter n=1 Tax=Halobaculum lipolyticum TaxID=3032001 RepID=A0ABD5WCY4_9EURY|nr:calcium/sodium antiporter [Halobaculum sp. DT31]